MGEEINDRARPPVARRDKHQFNQWLDAEPAPFRVSAGISPTLDSAPTGS